MEANHGDCTIKESYSLRRIEYTLGVGFFKISSDVFSRSFSSCFFKPCFSATALHVLIGAFTGKKKTQNIIQEF